MKDVVWTAKAHEHIWDNQLQVFEQMYTENMARVYQFVKYRVGDKEIAEDLTSSIFEQALKRLNQYDKDRGAFSAWLYSIARRIVANHFRTLNRRPVTVELIENELHLESPDSDPEETLIQKRRWSSINRIISNLPEREQDIIALKFGSGFSNREISNILRLSESNVGTIIHRAIQKIREEIHREGWEL